MFLKIDLVCHRQVLFWKVMTPISQKRHDIIFWTKSHLCFYGSTLRHVCMLPDSQLQRTDYWLILITIFTSRPCICSEVTIANSNQGRRHPFSIRFVLVRELLLSNISSTHDIILICFIANPFVSASIALTHLVLWNSITSIFKLRDPTMLVNNCSGCWRRLVSIIYICCMISDCAKINVQQSDYGKRFRVSRRQEVIISAI